jgi:NTE family protein
MSPSTAVLPFICVLLVTGCASAPAIRLPRVGPQTTCVTPRTERDVAIGVAASGGGSRAAMFAAAGLEALATVRTPDGGSLLEQVSHISSVSGGSLASAY